jgi:hypothetical protein
MTLSFLLQTLGSQPKQFRDGGQIIIGIRTAPMAQIRAQSGETAFHIGTLAIPTNEGVDGKPMPKIVDARPPGS